MPDTQLSSKLKIARPTLVVRAQVDLDGPSLEIVKVIEAGDRVEPGLYRQVADAVTRDWFVFVGN